jgi:thiamine transporter 2/3
MDERKVPVHESNDQRFWKKWTWFLPAFIVFYSFIKEIKVGEPFLFKYQTEYLNLTRDELKGEVYIWMPYSYMIALIPIFLLTDLFLYKPTMLIEILGQIGFRALLVFGHSVFSQVIGIISYGIASASEVAFFSYVSLRQLKLTDLWDVRVISQKMEAS